MTINAYVDESGDLGWTFNKEYRKGGSSRFYICATMVIPAHLAGMTKNKIKEIYRDHGFCLSQEVKGSLLSKNVRNSFCRSVGELLSDEPSIKLRVIVLKKEQTPDILRNGALDSISNHMVYLGISGLTEFADTVKIIADEKPISKNRISSADDYLKTRIWFDNKNFVSISYTTKSSKTNLNLIFIDWIASTFWRFFENDDPTGFDVLQNHVDIVHLTF